MCHTACSGVRNTCLRTFSRIGKANVSVLRKSLVESELIEERKDGIFLADPVFEIWLRERI